MFKRLAVNLLRNVAAVCVLIYGAWNTWRYKRLTITLLKYLLPLSLLTYMVSITWEPAKGPGLKDVWYKNILTGGAGVHWDYLLAAFMLFFAGFLVTLVRWYVLVRAQKLPLTIWNAFRLGMIGCFFNTFLPGSVGGDIIKAAALAREQSRRTVAVATVLMDRIIGLWGLFWFVGLLGVSFWLTGQLDAEGPDGKSKLVIVITLSFLAVSVVVWAAMGFLSNERAAAFAQRLDRLPKLGGSAAEFWRAVWLYRCRPTCVYVAIMLSWLGFAFFVPTFYFSALTLSPDVQSVPTLQQHFVLVPIGLIIAAVPGFPGGLGLSEGGFFWLYELFGSQGQLGVWGSFVQRILITWPVALIGIVVYLVMPPAKVTPSTAADSAIVPEPISATTQAMQPAWLPAQTETSIAL